MTKSRNKLLLRRQQVWVLVIASLFAADFVFNGYLPSHRRLENLAQARTQHERIIDTAVAQAEVLPALEVRHKEIVKQVSRYEDSVPAQSNLGLFLGQIAELMTEHQLANQVVVPGTEVKAGELNCIPVQMDCTGTLDGVFGFFADLGNMSRLVRINKISLKNDTGFTGTVSMQTEAMIFYRPQTGPEKERSVGRPLSEGADHGA